jgi:hypothetical protein
MKHHKLPKDLNPIPVSAAQSTAAASLIEGAKNYVPEADEVARRAYFTYVNQGSLPGHEVQHWLTAEAELIAERNQTRIHGFHNRT